MAIWQDRSVRENGAQLYGPRVYNLLSHGIVKSLTFRVYGKLEFQCTRNGPQNLPFCPGSIQNTFINFSSISHHQIFQQYVANKINLEIQQSGNPKTQVH
jgi:hypothetical protein